MRCNLCPPVILCPLRAVSLDALVKASIYFTRDEIQQCRRLPQNSSNPAIKTSSN